MPDKRHHRCNRTCSLLLALLLAGALAPAAVAEPQSLHERVREAALATYVHGMTEEIALREFGPQAIPALLGLLADPDFPRRDNLVAVLGYLGEARATRGLLRLLERPPASVERPIEDRALLLAPQSLGQIASRGEPGALDALMSMTAPGGNGGILVRTAARASHPAALRDDLLQMALRGLAHAGSPAARGRLDAIAQGRSRPAAAGRDLDRPARRALELFDAMAAGAEQGEHPGRDTDGGAAMGQPAPAFDDKHFLVRTSRIDYANHVNVTNPMSDERLDDALAGVSLRLGRADFEGDVACCAGVVRVRNGDTFGSANDGLDIIDNVGELNAVLNHSVARFKVVRMINYCGGPSTNVIGCAWIGGYGAAVVRYGSVGTEGTLWAHEYGHNVGLPHSTAGSSYIMYSILGSSSRGVSQQECDLFHTPQSSAGASQFVAGNCTDGDTDEVHDVVDNCPDTANPDQLDTDDDGRGDVCERGCGDGTIDPEESCDGDNFGGETCQGLGFDDGELGCRADCTLDTSGCSVCGNGVVEGNESCDGADTGDSSCSAVGCNGGAPRCSASCSVEYDECTDCPVCDNDGLCESGEDCEGCPADCATGAASVCGDGVCDATDGEDCVSCPQDCAGRQSGGFFGRYCCGAGGGWRPVDCNDSRCNSGDWVCTDAPTAQSCCGDLSCEGMENGFICEVDCGPPASCGDGFCDTKEDSCSCAEDCGPAPASEASCSDGVDDDCDGLADCSDDDCNEDPACNSTCGTYRESCDTNSDCCSNRCRGMAHRRVCR